MQRAIVVLSLTVFACSSPSSPDSGTSNPDAGTTPDAGMGSPFDAGPADSGSVEDAGSEDAGVPDLGTPDAGTSDAGTVMYTLTVTNELTWCSFTIDGTSYPHNASASQSFAAGTVVTLTAAPLSGFIWGSWTGTSDNSTESTTVTMSGNENVTVCCPDPGETTCP